MDKRKILLDVPYLEESDVNDQGELIPSVCKGKPTLVLLQANFCPHCTVVKPDFQKLLNHNDKFTIATIQCDGGDTDKKACQKISNRLGEKFRGFPTYVIFNKNGSFKEICEVGRDYNSLNNYMQRL
jgi:thiol-disulfide isomerase/thioredoxin